MFTCELVRACINVCAIFTSMRFLFRRSVAFFFDTLIVFVFYFSAFHIFACDKKYFCISSQIIINVDRNSTSDKIK